jgi:hypothetical protein
MSDFEFEREPSKEPEPQERSDPEFYDVERAFHQTRMGTSAGLELLPKGLPSASALGAFEPSLREHVSLQSHTEDEIRVIYWTVAVENAFETAGYARKIPWFKTATYGFADPEAEEDAFGVIAYVALSFHEPRDRKVPDRLEVNGESFPIIFRQAEWHLHSKLLPYFESVHPADGTSTCWAMSNRLPKRELAILTAKHVVGKKPVGSSIPLKSSEPSLRGHGTLLDVAPDGIDAAIIGVPRSLARLDGGPLEWQKFIAQWTDVEVYSTSGTFSTKITEVNSGRGTLDSSIPLRIFLATPGQAGDSGALVLDYAGRGVGLYMGSITTPANVQEGFCQHLGQAAESLDLDLFASSLFT